MSPAGKLHTFMILEVAAAQLNAFESVSREHVEPRLLPVCIGGTAVMLFDIEPSRRVAANNSLKKQVLTDN